MAEPAKHSSLVRIDISNEQLRAQINKLQYELDTIKQERQLRDIEHDNRVRKLEQSANAHRTRAEKALDDSQTAAQKLTQHLAQAQSERQQHESKQTETLRSVRQLQDSNSALQEQLSEAEARATSATRQHEHAHNDLQKRYTATQESIKQIQSALDEKVSALQSLSQITSTRDRRINELESEVMHLKTQTRDADSLNVIRRQLGDQVAYIRQIEAANKQQALELGQLKERDKSVQVVQEEKRELLVKVRLLDDVRRELVEAQLQRQILEDEKSRWTSYLAVQTKENQDVVIKTPEELARAYIAERIDRLALLDKLGAIKPELAVKDETIHQLEADHERLNAELRKARSVNAAPISDDKIRARLERQRNLAAKEVDYLRAQIRAYEAEESENKSPDGNDTAASTSGRVQELEKLMDEHRSEIKTLHESLTAAECSKPAPQEPASPRKRPREDTAADERLGELSRKLRTLEDSRETLQGQNTKLQTELQATILQLSELRDSTKTRVLELRKNPTSTARAIKTSTLTVLREENAVLAAQLSKQELSPQTFVPRATLHKSELQIADLQSQLAQRDKKTERLKSQWIKQFQGVATAVESTLGWAVQFLPNGKFKVSPSSYKTRVNDEGEEEDNSILFDGEQGTMKVSGGVHSKWEEEIRPLIEFWVDGRKQVPCFLAALILELNERATTRVG